MSKHKRASNFSKKEEETLIKLVLEKKHIFQNKKTDAVTSKLKDAAWEELAQKYNASSFDEVRKPKVLREKYNNMKRVLRKKKANKHREYCYSPSSQKEWKVNNSLLDELSDVMSASVDGFPSRHDETEDDTISYKQIYDQNELKEEMIDYFDEDDDQDAEALGNCDVSCAVFADISMRMDEEAKTSPNNCDDYHLEKLDSQGPDLLKTSKTEKADVSDITLLKKQILEQQFHHARLEHEQKTKHARLEHQQRILHSAEEHKIKIKLLEAELELKKSLIK